MLRPSLGTLSSNILVYLPLPLMSASFVGVHIWTTAIVKNACCKRRVCANPTIITSAEEEDVACFMTNWCCDVLLGCQSLGPSTIHYIREFLILYVGRMDSFPQMGAMRERTSKWWRWQRDLLWSQRCLGWVQWSCWR